MDRSVLGAFTACALSLASFTVAFEGTPDFTGTWAINTAKSDDFNKEVLASWGDPNRMSPKDRRIAERLELLASAFDRFEIRQSQRDITLYHQDDVRIYYIDGKKHTRETPWGEKLETVTNWEGDELHLRTDGKDLGEVDEMYAFEGAQMVYTVRVKLKSAKEDLVVQSYFDRARQ